MMTLIIKILLFIVLLILLISMILTRKRLRKVVEELERSKEILYQNQKSLNELIYSCLKRLENVNASVREVLTEERSISNMISQGVNPQKVTQNERVVRMMTKVMAENNMLKEKIRRYVSMSEEKEAGLREQAK